VNNDDRIQYLANIFYLVNADGKISEEESRAFAEVAKDLGAGHSDKCDALAMAQAQGFDLCFPGQDSDRVRNVEDLLFVACCDGEFSAIEKKIVTVGGLLTDISDEQFAAMKANAKKRVVQFREQA
jgi:uncharacterized tellurite resistance protein B-like protein